MDINIILNIICGDFCFLISYEADKANHSEFSTLKNESMFFNYFNHENYISLSHLWKIQVFIFFLKHLSRPDF